MQSKKLWVNISIVFFILFILILGLFSTLFAHYPRKYQSVIKNYGEDTAFIWSIIKAESNFNPEAVSKAGAIGLMQVMPQTADYIVELYHLEKGDLTNPEYNIGIGINYLKYLKGKFQDTKTLLCAYNAGEGKVTEWIKNKDYSFDGLTLQKIPFQETAEYVERIEKNYSIYKFIK